MKKLFVLLFAFTIPLFAQESKMTSKVFIRNRDRH